MYEFRQVFRGVSVLVLTAALSVGMVGAPGSVAAGPVPGDAFAPVLGDQTWQVCEGYGGSAYTSEYYSIFLSPTCGNEAAGQPALAMKDGWVYSYDSFYGQLCINADSGGSYKYSRIHQGPQTSGTVVRAGERVGTVGNYGQFYVLTPRLQVNVYAGINCGATTNPLPVPFDAAHGWRICGLPDMTPTGPGTSGVWGRTSFTAAPCTALSPRPAIRGELEVGASESAGRVHVKGWAYDPVDPATPLQIQAEVTYGPFTDAHIRTTTANLPRADVVAVYPGIGDHGFDFTFDSPIYGTVILTVYAKSPSDPTPRQLGSWNVSILNPTPRFAFDLAEAPAAQRIRVVGWAFDPRALATPYRIHAYVGAPTAAAGGEFHDLGPAALSRPVIETNYPGMGTLHGFDATFSTALSGDQPVYLYAIPDAAVPDMRAQTLGSKAVSVPASPVTPPSPSPEPSPPAVPPPPPSTPPSPPATTLSVRLKVRKHHSLRIDVNPDWAAGNYRVIVQQARGQRWKRVEKLRTKGQRDIAKLRVHPGRYRVIVLRRGYVKVTSRAVRVRR